MKRTGLLTLSAALILCGCGGSSTTSTSKPKPINPDESQVSGKPGMAPVEYLGTVAAGKKKAERDQALALLKQGIQNYRIAEGGNPKSLQDVVNKGYLNSVPKAPYGMKINYDPKSGEVAIVMAQ